MLRVRRHRQPNVLLFWIVFIFTRPFGATIFARDARNFFASMTAATFAFS
jgi:uncharacterized membrane-anchored protein